MQALNCNLIRGQIHPSVKFAINFGFVFGLEKKEFYFGILWKSQLHSVYCCEVLLKSSAQLIQVSFITSVALKVPTTTTRRRFDSREKNLWKDDEIEEKELAQSHASDDSKANKQNIPGMSSSRSISRDFLDCVIRRGLCCVQPQLAKVPEKSSRSTSPSVTFGWLVSDVIASAGICAVTQSNHFSRNSCLCESFSELKNLISSGLSLADSENLIGIGGNIPSSTVT